MSLEPNDIRDFLEEEHSFPSRTETVVAEIGDLEIVSPDSDEAETIGDLLAEVEAEEYASADELTQMLHSLLPDEYIGRKFYDDRSDEPVGTETSEQRDDRSF